MRSRHAEEIDQAIARGEARPASAIPRRSPRRGSTGNRWRKPAMSHPLPSRHSIACAVPLPADHPRLARARRCGEVASHADRPGRAHDEDQQRPHPDHPCRQPAAAAGALRAAFGEGERRVRSTRRTFEASTAAAVDDDRGAAGGLRHRHRQRRRDEQARPTRSMCATASPASARAPRRRRSGRKIMIGRDQHRSSRLCRRATPTSPRRRFPAASGR